MSRLLGRRRGTGTPRDVGMTLAELLVTMMVLSVLTAMVAALFTSVTRSFTKDRAETDNTRIASIAMNEVTRVIRSGTEIRVANQSLNNPVFLVATGESVVLRAYLDTDSASPKPVVVRFEISSSRILVEKRWNAVPGTGPYWTFTGLPTAAPQTASSFWTGYSYQRSIARAISPQTDPGLMTFTYWTKDRVQVPVPATGTMTDAQLRSIASVTVRVSVQTDLTARAKPVVIQNSVGIPNLGVSRVGP